MAKRKRESMTPAERERADLKWPKHGKVFKTQSKGAKVRPSKFAGKDEPDAKPKGPPSRLSNRIKELRRLMDQHDLLAAKLAPLAEAVAKAREKILNEFTDSEIGTTTAHGLRVTKSRHQSPRIADSSKFMAFATRKKNWDLLQKSCNTPAWRERLKDGVVVPGVDVFNSVSVSVTRVA